MNKKQRKAKRDAQKLVGIFDDLIDKDAKVKILPDVPEPREIARKLIMFWREEKCLGCHTIYQGSLYHSEPLLQCEVQTPIVHFGRMYGWKFKGIKLRPIADASCYDHLPHEIEIIKTTVRVCPKCIHTPKVIYLPGIAS